MGDGWLNRQSPSRLSKLEAKIAPCTFAYIISFKFPTQNASNPISEYRAVLAVNIISMKMIILPIYISNPLSKLMITHECPIGILGQVWCLIVYRFLIFALFLTLILLFSFCVFQGNTKEFAKVAGKLLIYY